MANLSSITVSYKAVWKSLIEKELRRRDSRRMTRLCRASITKPRRRENATKIVSMKTTFVLNGDTHDACGIVPTDTKRETN